MSRCSFDSYWKIIFNQSQIQSMILTSTLHIRKHVYYYDLDFIILFVGILSLYAIYLDVVSLFADSLFIFLAMLIMLLYQMYFIDLNEWISFYLSKKKIPHVFFWKQWNLPLNSIRFKIRRNFIMYTIHKTYFDKIF